MLSFQATHRQAEEEAAAAFAGIQATLAGHARARCTPAADPAPLAAFREALRAARASWEASPLRPAVEAARRAQDDEAERRAAEERERVPGQRPASEVLLPWNPWREARVGDWTTYLFDGRAARGSGDEGSIRTVVTWRVVAVEGDAVTVVRESDRGARSTLVVPRTGPCPLSAILADPERVRCTELGTRPVEELLHEEWSATTFDGVELLGHVSVRGLGGTYGGGRIGVLSERVPGPGLLRDHMAYEGRMGGGGDLRGHGTAAGTTWGMTRPR